MAGATPHIHHGNARTIFNAAIEAEHIAKNPFKDLVARSTPSDYRRHITDEEIDRVIQHAPIAEWKLLLGLARYAGLWVPSETHLLRRDDIDLERGRMTVWSPKTERHPGHESRTVPIDPRLFPLMVERSKVMRADETHLITVPGQSNRERTVRRICKRAGVEPWKRTWQTVRASAEIDWASRFPQYAVSRWIGHSMLISERHFANHVPEEIFVAAGGIEGRGRPHQVQEGALRPRSAEGRSDAKFGDCPNFSVSTNSFIFGDLRESSAVYLPQNEWSGGGSNP